jgi:MinD superfamily P-loop ATPase
MHDLDRVLGVCQHFGVPALVCINKYDLNEENTQQIESSCLDQGVRIAGKISYDDVITQSIVKGVPVVEYSDGRVTRQIERMWGMLSAMLDNDSKG